MQSLFTALKIESYLESTWCVGKVNTDCTISIDSGQYQLERVIRYKSGDKKTVRSRVEDSAVDYWVVHVGGAKNKNNHFYTRTTDTQRGNSLHFTAENSIPIPNS